MVVFLKPSLTKDGSHGTRYETLHDNMNKFHTVDHYLKRQNHDATVTSVHSAAVTFTSPP